MSQRLVKVIVTFFAIIGITFLSIFLHEITHVIDFAPTNYSNGRLCAIQIENITYNPSGYFKFYVPKEKEQVFDRIDKYAEVKAYFVTFIIMVIGVTALMFYLFEDYQRALIEKYK